MENQKDHEMTHLKIMDNNARVKDRKNITDCYICQAIFSHKKSLKAHIALQLFMKAKSHSAGPFVIAFVQ